MNKQKIAEWLVDNWYKIQFLLVFILVATIICLCVKNWDCKAPMPESCPSEITSDTIYVRCSDCRYDSLLMETNINLVKLGLLMQENGAKLDIIINKLQCRHTTISTGSTSDLTSMRKQLDDIYNVLEYMRDDSVAVSVRKIKKR